MKVAPQDETGQQFAIKERRIIGAEIIHQPDGFEVGNLLRAEETGKNLHQGEGFGEVFGIPTMSVNPQVGWDRNTRAGITLGASASLLSQKISAWCCAGGFEFWDRGQKTGTVFCHLPVVMLTTGLWRIGDKTLSDRSQSVGADAVVRDLTHLGHTIRCSITPIAAADEQAWTESTVGVLEKATCFWTFRRTAGHVTRSDPLEEKANIEASRTRLFDIGRVQNQQVDVEDETE
ncbi:hypothetical protein KC338_g174 [Hortaea werneckii]|nr:hypothetical protein KC338_g174 [Hortaea werneckii]